MSRQCLLGLRKKVVTQEVELLHQLLLDRPVHLVLACEVFDNLVHVLANAQQLLESRYTPIEVVLLLLKVLHLFRFCLQGSFNGVKVLINRLLFGD
jgi:hypothetical protein